MNSANESRPPVPPFASETGIQKVGMAEDAWNSRDPKRVALAYTTDSRWRNAVRWHAHVLGRVQSPGGGLTTLAHSRGGCNGN